MVAIKNGNKLGTTLFAQSFKPDFAAAKLLLENTTKDKVKVTNIMESKFFRKETNKLLLFVFVLYLFCKIEELEDIKIKLLKLFYCIKIY